MLRTTPTERRQSSRRKSYLPLPKLSRLSGCATGRTPRHRLRHSLPSLDSSADGPAPSAAEHFADREIPIVGAAPAANAAATELAPVVDRVVVPAAKAAATEPAPAVDRVAPARARELIPREPAVVAAPSSFGFNARLGSAVAVAAIVGVLALGVYRHERGREVAASLATNDTTRQAAGDIAAGAARADSAIPPAAAPPLATAPQPVVTIPPKATRPPITSSSDPVARRPVDIATPTMPTLPRDSARASERTTTRDTTGMAVATEPCASAESEDQHKCLMAAIDRNDRELNSVFGRLVAALRRQASAAASDPDPDTVDELRAVTTQMARGARRGVSRGWRTSALRARAFIVLRAAVVRPRA